MTHIKIMTFFCVLCGIFLVLMGCGETETVGIDTDIEDARLLKSGIENENNLCLVRKSDIAFYLKGVVPGEYVVLYDTRMTTKTIPNAADFGAELIKIRKYEYRFYDVHSGEELKVIDVKEKLDEGSMAKKWRGYQFDHNSYLYFFQGDPYINIWFTSIPTKHSTEEENDEEMAISLNLETEEMKVLEQKDMDQLMDNSRFYEYQWIQSIFWDMDLVGQEEEGYSLLGRNGFPSNDAEEKGVNLLDEDNQGTVCIKVSSDYLPEQNETLYAEFPELKEYAGKEGYEVEIYLADYPSAEEIMDYVLEDGQEISFEGAILSGDKSIDGQSHDIHSFEEYYQWRKQTEDTDALLSRID